MGQGVKKRDGVVSLAGCGVHVVSVALRLGSEGLCPPIVLPCSNQAGRKKGALSPSKLTMPSRDRCLGFVEIRDWFGGLMYSNLPCIGTDRKCEQRQLLG